MLRKMNGYSQEQIAEKIDISRQAYAKWESGATVPDAEKAAFLADVYGVTIDSLLKTETVDGIGGQWFRCTGTMGGCIPLDNGFLVIREVDRKGWKVFAAEKKL